MNARNIDDTLPLPVKTVNTDINMIERSNGEIQISDGYESIIVPNETKNSSIVM